MNVCQLWQLSDLRTDRWFTKTIPSKLTRFEEPEAAFSARRVGTEVHRLCHPLQKTTHYKCGASSPRRTMCRRSGFHSEEIEKGFPAWESATCTLMEAEKFTFKPTEMKKPVQILFWAGFKSLIFSGVKQTEARGDLTLHSTAW